MFKTNFACLLDLTHVNKLELNFYQKFKAWEFFKSSNNVKVLLNAKDSNPAQRLTNFHFKGLKILRQGKDSMFKILMNTQLM